VSTSSRCLIVAVVALVLHPPALAAQTKLPAVVADLDTIYTLADGRQFTNKGRYYRSKDGLIREDSPLGAIITDIKSGTLTMLNFERREAHVMKVAASSGATTARNLPPAVRYADATVDGRKVTKARAENGKGEAQELWTANDLGLVVFSKVSSPNLTMAKSLRNIALKQPDASVFKVPAGFTVTKHDTGKVPRPAMPTEPVK
jgi:hypothetical protein